MILTGEQSQIILRKAAAKGSLRLLGHRAETEGREDHAPPVVPFRPTDLHPQALILSGREGEIGVDFGGEIGALQTDFYRVIIPFLGNGWSYVKI